MLLLRLCPSIILVSVSLAHAIPSHEFRLRYIRQQPIEHIVIKTVFVAGERVGDTLVFISQACELLGGGAFIFRLLSFKLLVL